ncbi:DEKNAAC104968 [Brettanomyces naardenensis]|uniref:Arp2/3 complex 34 kDa subunit n=1 Tax=Brettanomyces naardenensis TaxID=13370 RepID=A0A448YS47_BRENA|nr:DEKNAAC104968 [Brettanomyces naardenensis]
MLLLQPENLLIQKTFSKALSEDYIPATLDRVITDFDFTAYHISTPSDKTGILLSVGIKCWADLIAHGTLELLESIYSKYSSFLQILSDGNAEPGYNYGLYLELGKVDLQNGEEIATLISDLSLLKRNCFAAPFLEAFGRYEVLAQEEPVDPNNIYGEDAPNNSKEPVIALGYRDNESIFIKPSNDRVTVIFSTIFNDETDKVFSKVFLQEFSDARKRSIQKAPQVINSHHDIPLEIQGLEKENSDNKKTYITFVLFPRHLSTDEVKWNSITQIETFRSYFHYHIKIVKCYLHQRMRFRVQSFTKILNRARRDVTEEELRSERKTASGRRFEQRT